MSRLAQSSIEFLVVTGIGLLLITGVAFSFLQFSRNSGDQVTIDQVSSIGADIIEQARIYYALGRGSWTSVEVNMPDNVLAIYTVENNTLVFDVGTQAGIVSQPVFSPVPIVGVNTTASISAVNQGAVLIHQGPTKFRITPLGTVVQIEAIT